MTWRAEALMAATPSERAYLCTRGAKAARHVAVSHGFGQISAWRLLAVQNSRQRIEFWALVGVQPIEYGKEWQVNGCLKFLILGVRLKIRSFGESFEALVLQGGRFRRKRGVSEARREKSGGVCPGGTNTPARKQQPKREEPCKAPPENPGLLCVGYASSAVTFPSSGS